MGGRVLSSLEVMTARVGNARGREVYGPFPDDEFVYTNKLAFVLLRDYFIVLRVWLITYDSRTSTTPYVRITAELSQKCVEWQCVGGDRQRSLLSPLSLTHSTYV